MKLLEAQRVLREAGDGEPLSLRLAMSGTPDALLLYLKAAAAEKGFSLDLEVLPFNTLRQFVATREPDAIPTRFVLLPWDFVPALDWRSGVAERPPSDESIAADVSDFMRAMGDEGMGASTYLPAPVPPFHHHPSKTRDLTRSLAEAAASRGARLWPREWFSLSAYLASGTPLVSTRLGEAARELVDSVTAGRKAPRKVLVTDLDGVLWWGVVGEDGPRGIDCRPEGRGYRHFLFQTFLRKIKGEGTLLAAVSRNDPALVDEAFRQAPLSLAQDDFVSIVASYHAKSAQIRQIADVLGLGLDSFVFVDDNPVELAEVEGALPQVTSLRFPTRDEGLTDFFDTLSDLFGREAVTEEDEQRTALYQQRLESLPPSEARGADLFEFLGGLEMRLVVRAPNIDDAERAVQLINKTNQFNLNGIRRSEPEVGEVVAAGGRLYTAALMDRTGSHGEILTCLIDRRGTIRSFVMSCRVFQRRVEHRFLRWLAERDEGTPRALEFAPTPRNEPLRRFLASLGAELPSGPGEVQLDPGAIRKGTVESASLFQFEHP